MLIIRKLYREFPHRVVEWGLSYILISWGAVLLVTQGAFESATWGVYTGWREIAPQHIWGFGAFSIGMTRLAALYINGAHVRSPILRTVAGFLSMYIWFWATVGVLRGEPIVTASLAIYPWLMIADMYAVYTAAGDAYQARYYHGKNQENVGAA